MDWADIDAREKAKEASQAKQKKEMDSEGVLREVRDRRHYKKPSVKAREKSIAARKRRAKELKNME